MCTGAVHRETTGSRTGDAGSGHLSRQRQCSPERQIAQQRLVDGLAEEWLTGYPAGLVAVALATPGRARSFASKFDVDSAYNGDDELVARGLEPFGAQGMLFGDVPFAVEKR